MGFDPRPRGLKSKCLSVFLNSVLQIAGDGVRTHAAWFEIQVLVDESYVDFVKLLAAGFEPRSRGSKSTC